MCAHCKRETLTGLAALVHGIPEPRSSKVKGASLVPKIKWVKREPTKVQKVERQVKLEELSKWLEVCKKRHRKKGL